MSGLPADGAVTVTLDVAPRVHAVLHENAVPLVHRVVVRNGGTTPLRDVVVRLVSDPPFSEPWEARVGSIAAGAAHAFTPVAPELHAAAILDRVERTAGRWIVEVDAAGAPAARATAAVELLAWDEWPGSAAPLELLAAFVQPNQRALAPLLRRAADILATDAGGGIPLDGYRPGDRARVRAQVAAPWQAVTERDLARVGVPPSFEATGQRVRLADRVLEDRLANCLDLSLLLAACIEGPVGESATELRKRADLGRVVVVEATLPSGPRPASFDEAVAAARRRPEDDREFIAALDVGVARSRRIRPLPSRVAAAPGVDPADTDVRTPPSAPIGPTVPNPVPPRTAA